MLRKLSLCLSTAVLAWCLSGCSSGDRSSIGSLENVWGRRGISNGRLQKPRAMAIDRKDNIYLVDMTARIQVFDRNGKYLRGWQTPEHKFGRPTGLSIDHNGNVLVPDTHYYRVLTYSPEGKLLDTLGGTNGHAPGEFGLVTDAVEDSKGNLYVSEYGEYDRIQKFTPDHKYVLEWGSHGDEPGQFVRPQCMAVDAEDHIWVADACNHRIQIFDTSGKLLRMWGKPGQAVGELYYPYSIVLDGEGHVYVCEYGNHRIQKFTLDGKSLGIWGTHGREPGQMHNPWAIVRDSHGSIFVLDTNNHRVQQVTM